MRGLMLLVAMLAIGAPRFAEADAVVVFVDGSRMEVRSYEVKDAIVLLTTKDGKLQSVPRSYVNLEATEQANRSGQTTAPSTGGPSTPPAEPRQAPPPAPSPTKPAPKAPAAPTAPATTAPRAPREMPTESVEPEPPVKAVVPAPPPTPSTPSSPPPVWSNDELKVSLVVPSGAWKIEEMPASFDVAVTLANESAESKATLALMRQKIRSKKDFTKAVAEVEASISQSPGYRAIENAELSLDPYTAHEFRFVKSGGSGTIYSRLVVFFSKDLAYVLSLTCPENRRAENEADFESLVRGLVIKKGRNDLTF